MESVSYTHLDVYKRQLDNHDVETIALCILEKLGKHKYMKIQINWLHKRKISSLVWASPKFNNAECCISIVEILHILLLVGNEYELFFI